MMKHLVEKGADFSVNEVSPLKVLTKGAKVPLLHTGYMKNPCDYKLDIQFKFVSSYELLIHHSKCRRYLAHTA